MTHPCASPIVIWPDRQAALAPHCTKLHPSVASAALVLPTSAAACLAILARNWVTVELGAGGGILAGPGGRPSRFPQLFSGPFTPEQRMQVALAHILVCSPIGVLFPCTDMENTSLQLKLDILAEFITKVESVTSIILFIALMIQFFVQLGTGNPLW